MTRTAYIIALFATLFGAGLMVSGCTNSLDATSADTRREIGRFAPKAIDVSAFLIDTNGKQYAFPSSAKSGINAPIIGIELDTSYSPSALWLQLQLDAPQLPNDSLSVPVLRSMLLRVDSLTATGEWQQITGNRVQFVITTPIGNADMRTDTLNSDAIFNTMNVRLFHVPEKKTFTMDFSGSIYLGLLSASTKPCSVTGETVIRY